MTDWLWLSVPVAASALMAVSLVPLGQRVLARGVVFADLAIAQWAALGTLTGRAWMPNHTVAGLPFNSLLFALLAVTLVHLMVQRAAAYREALIGSLYVLGASLATLIVSHNPHGAQHLAQTLNGDLLWVTPSALPTLGIMAALVLAWQALRPSPLQAGLFLPLFAVAVTLTVELAGIYVVFATLIVSPLALCHLRSRGILAAVAAALAGHALGLALSAHFDLPAGPLVVTAIVGVGMLALVTDRPSVSDGKPDAAPSVSKPENR
ncbi:metal ABC transporter permease [Marinobacter zhejiangensis]|uniref:Zinc/manganese transport system permease protein n=1 Tax=Marinobacter zhejiangensis TaxID=488535 RepID=A0A1I4PZ57_9GAMM|nr:metal ABC transporter permease [Marinobacter zhejiangensis]SFM33044.1 zinc/manganese transport system permease protein [Marinobacter zhejiangensis]